ncbi:MAG: hypothetical protein EXS58_04525 [Candidatus Latescibacteria bacterium]|nr:hypothetical protein [Candidatus Latescibacterota bacterium]
MQLACEGHEQIRALSEGLRLVLNPPVVLEGAVLQGASPPDASGASIYGSVMREAGRFRMWYQAWPKDWDGEDVVAVACAESEDGLNWRRPDYGLIASSGSKHNHLTDLPFHSPTIFVDPHAGPEARYRAFGYTAPKKLRGLYPHQVNRPGYYTAHSADGLHWQLDSTDPVWPYGDVISAVWDPQADCARIALKISGRAAGMYRRRFYGSEWARGQISSPVSTLIPDEHDDTGARARGFHTADYYGVGLMPTAGPTIGFLWNFRHQLPLGHSTATLAYHGRSGTVDLSVVYQLERGGRWFHLPGRPDWLRALDAPSWARGALYTSSSPVEVGEETWLYFTGTKDRHGWCGHEVDYNAYIRAAAAEGGFARIGLAKWRRHRLMGYQAVLPERLHLAPRPAVQGRLALNVLTRSGGSVRVGLAKADGQPLPGFELDKCVPLAGDHLETPVRWQGDPELPRLVAGEELVAQVELQDATLYAFDFTLSP